MRRILPIIVALVLAYYRFSHPGTNTATHNGSEPPRRDANAPNAPIGGAESPGTQALVQAFNEHRSYVRVESRGVVVKVLPDDTEGDKHQRFILRLDTGQTIMFAHNIDLAPRVDGLKAGDVVEFNGEYVWNEQGGVVHWTHRDPSGRHATGWLKHDGHIYQ